MNTRKRIYIAGPLFSDHERKFLEELTITLAQKLELDPRKDIFLPHRDAGIVGIHRRGRNDVFSCDLKSLDDAAIVIAVLDGPDVDSGTAVELGYAFAEGKKVFGILTDWRRWHPLTNEVRNVNNMIWGICEKGKKIYKKVNGKLIRDLKEALRNHE